MNREELQNVLKSLMLAAAVSGVAFVGVGCEEAGDDDVNDAQATIDDAAGEYNEAKSEYADRAADEVANMRDKVEEKAEEMREQANVALENLAGPELAEQAKTMLAKAEEYIRAGNFPEAKAIIEKLEAVQAKLPEGMAAQLDTVKGLLEKAEGAGEAADKLKEMGGGLMGGDK